MVVKLKRWAVAMMLCLAPWYSYSATMQTKVSYFDVSATDLSELRSAVNRSGPQKRGKRYSMAASYHFSWTPKVQSRGEQCEAKAPQTDLQADLTMPRWISQSRADFAEQQAWIMFISAGQQYHQAMVEIVERNASRFVQQTTGLSADSCERLNDLINAKGRAALNKTRQQLRTYQRRTQYGLSLGLRLP